MSFAGKITAVIKVAGTRGGLRALLTWKPFSLTAFRMTQALRDTVPELRTVVDAGSNVGQFARAISSRFPDADIICFEPVPAVFDLLTRNIADVARAELHAYALGDKSGSLAFHINKYSHASSALEMLPEAKRALPMLGDVQEAVVEIRTLDDLLGHRELRRPSLLKLDLQGFELQALRGAQGSVLRSTDYVLVETPFQASYVGQPLFDDIYVFLTSAGFKLIGPLDVLTDAQGRYIQADLLFANDGSS